MAYDIDIWWPLLEFGVALFNIKVLHLFNIKRPAE